MSRTYQTIACDTLDDFARVIRTEHVAAPSIYRGHANAGWKLQSMVDRWLDRGMVGDSAKRDFDGCFTRGREGRKEVVHTFLKAFREISIGLPGIEQNALLDDRRAWALGRHHGLFTPLLDWTRSPYVALFFACYDAMRLANPGWETGPTRGGTKSPSGHLAIWELCLVDGLPRENEFEWFTDRDQCAYRQKAQQGIFTILTHQRCVDIESYLQEREQACYLTKYVLPAHIAFRSLWDLNLMNISYATLYPDFHGAAIQANIQHSLLAFELRETVLNQGGIRVLE